MRPTTNQTMVDNFDRNLKEQSKNPAKSAQSDDVNFDFDKGFKFAYESFVQAYYKRDFSDLSDFCEKNLVDAIKKEPLINYDYYNFTEQEIEKDACNHYFITPQKK